MDICCYLTDNMFKDSWQPTAKHFYWYICPKCYCKTAVLVYNYILKCSEVTISSIHFLSIHRLQNRF